MTSTTASTGFIPIPQRPRSTDGLDRFARVNIRELVEIRNEVARRKHQGPAMSQVHKMLAGLIDKLEKQEQQ